MGSARFRSRRGRRSSRRRQRERRRKTPRSNASRRSWRGSLRSSISWKKGRHWRAVDDVGGPTAAWRCAKLGAERDPLESVGVRDGGREGIHTLNRLLEGERDVPAAARPALDLLIGQLRDLEERIDIARGTNTAQTAGIDRDPPPQPTSSGRATPHAADQTPCTWPQPTERHQPNKAPAKGPSMHGPSDRGECDDACLNRVGRLLRLARITARIGYKRRQDTYGGTPSAWRRHLTSAVRCGGAG